MNKKCKGCGIKINSNHDLCENCFAFIHYGKYIPSINEEISFLEVVKEINKNKSLVILVLDILNLPKDLDIVKNNINTSILIVLTKRDILPRSIKDNKLLDYIDNYGINYIDKEIISNKNNHHFDELKNKILKYKTEKVFVIGYTNAGKSSLINKLIYNYTDNKPSITTSYFTSTTLNTIEINFSDFILVDTPGIIIGGFPYDHNDKSILKKVNPSKEIKPRIYQIKLDQSFIIDNIVKIDIQSNNELTFYFSNALEISRIYKKNDLLRELEKFEMLVLDDEDVVINGLGFIRVRRKTIVTIYALKGTNIYTRKALI